MAHTGPTWYHDAVEEEGRGKKVEKSKVKERQWHQRGKCDRSSVTHHHYLPSMTSQVIV